MVMVAVILLFPENWFASTLLKFCVCCCSSGFLMCVCVVCVWCVCVCLWCVCGGGGVRARISERLCVSPSLSGFDSTIVVAS